MTENHAIIGTNVAIVTERATNFRLTVPENPTRFTCIRPYWIDIPVGNKRFLVDEEIVTELERVGFREFAPQCLSVIHNLESLYGKETT